MNDFVMGLSHMQKLKEKVVDIEVIKREVIRREKENEIREESEEGDARV